MKNVDVVGGEKTTQKTKTDSRNQVPQSGEDLMSIMKKLPKW